MKLAGLTIRNFGCIDENGVDILIDDIVVLIGPNNAGKSTVLGAYEAFASSGASLDISKFHGENPDKPVEIIGVFTQLSDEDKEKVGKWIHTDDNYGQCIRYRWLWTTPNQSGQKFSWDATAGEYVLNGVGGWDSIIASCIPVPLRVTPHDTSQDLEAKITDILTSAAKTGLKKDTGRLADVMRALTRLTEEFGKEVEEEVQKACKQISERLRSVFPGLGVEFQPSLGKFDAEKAIGAGSHIRISAETGTSIPLTQQGTGVQRAFLWSALGTLAEMGHMEKKSRTVSAGRPRILLIDEPESFLHPPSVRAAREALYAVAGVDGWQVMATTHSPVFIDVSKPHTSIVRIGRDSGSGSRVFSTERSTFDVEERTRLQMIRACHPTVNEFFFADHVVLVEGETEHAVLSILFDRYADQLRKHYHVVNCMGKANIPLFARILNQFQTPYTVIHDSDSPKVKRQEKWQKSGMWTVNTSIMTALKERPKNAPPSFAIAHVPDFEGYYFGERLEDDKPAHALMQLAREDFDTADELRALREFPLALANGTHPGLYTEMAELTERVRAWAEETGVAPAEQWAFDN